MLSFDIQKFINLALSPALGASCEVVSIVFGFDVSTITFYFYSFDTNLVVEIAPFAAPEYQVSAMWVSKRHATPVTGMPLGLIQQCVEQADEPVTIARAVAYGVPSA
jgi:hypothetical protein